LGWVWKSERGSQKLEFEKKPAQNHKKRTSFVKTLKTLKLGTSKTYKKSLPEQQHCSL
jgi:hypothetical protein